MNLTELKTARATAGSRYAAAIVELRAALVDLAALDGALSNGNVDPGFLDHATCGLPKIPPTLSAFEHKEFAPSLRDNLHDQIRASLTSYLEGFEP